LGVERDAVGRHLGYLCCSTSHEERIQQVSGRLERKGGGNIWKVTIPANGWAQMRYRVRTIPDE
jgi:hypothetical protein